jgi:hypothetical protein
MRKTIILSIPVILLIYIGFIGYQQNLALHAGEEELVTKYWQTNIKKLAPNKPVLGGSWQVVELNIKPAKYSGEVIYEDGHIQSQATFVYDIKDGKVIIGDVKLKE